MTSTVHWWGDTWPPSELIDTDLSSLGQPVIPYHLQDNAHFFQDRPGCMRPYDLPSYYLGNEEQGLYIVTLDLWEENIWQEVLQFLRDYTEWHTPSFVKDQKGYRTYNRFSLFAPMHCSWLFRENPRMHRSLAFGIRNKREKLCAVGISTILPMRLPNDCNPIARPITFSTTACIHPAFRGKRLVRTLLDEEIRRSHVYAKTHVSLYYTSGERIRGPHLAPVYMYNRPLNSTKMLALGLLKSMPKRWTQADLTHHFQVPLSLTLPGWRPMHFTDAGRLRQVFNHHYVDSDPTSECLCPWWETDNDVLHWFCPSPGTSQVYTFVRDEVGHPVYEFVSFIVLDNAIRDHPTITSLRTIDVQYGLCQALYLSHDTYNNSKHHNTIEEHSSAWMDDVLHLASKRLNGDELLLQAGIVRNQMGMDNMLRYKKFMFYRNDLKIRLNNWKCVSHTDFSPFIHAKLY